MHKRTKKLIVSNGEKIQSDGRPAFQLAIFARAGFKNNRHQEIQNKPEGILLRDFMKDKLSPQDIDDLFAITTYHASSKAYHYKPQEDTLGKNMVFRHGPLKRQLYKYFPEKIVDAIYTEEKLLHLSKLIPPFPKRRPYDQERGITVSSLNFFDDLRNCGRNQLS